MDIPILTNFVEGLKLFFASKRLKWLTLVFMIGAVTITVWENLVLMFPALGGVALVIGGVFPTFFMITGFLALFGLARFVADEESYVKSFIFTIIWFVMSLFVLAMMFFIRPFFNLMFIGVAFLGWIGFQSYFSTRSALGYAESVAIESRSKLVGFLYSFMYILNYVVIVGAFVYTFIFINPVIGIGTGVAILGMLLALGFNFMNGWILIAERNKSTASNISFLGLFISFYSAYFIYNVLKGFDPGLDIVGISITVFFILYTMSSVGRTLAARAELDTKLKLSKELAATFTFFLASGFMFVDAMFSIILGTSDPTLAGVVGDSVKLFIFPFVAFIMEMNYIRKSRKVPKAELIPEDIPVLADEPDDTEMEEQPEVSDVVADEEVVHEEESTYSEEITVDEDTSYPENEPDTEEESE